MRKASISFGQPDGTDDLLERFVAGDEKALWQAYDRYAGSVYHLHRSALGNDRDAERATAKTFVVAWRNRSETPAAEGSLLGRLLRAAKVTAGRRRGPDLERTACVLILADEIGSLPDSQRNAITRLLGADSYFPDDGDDLDRLIDSDARAAIRRLRDRWAADSATLQ